MFQEGNYNVLEFSLPAQGMNRNIAPEMLPPEFATVLENIIPSPLGSAFVRFGTQLLPNVTIDPDNTIIEMFSFAKPNGDNQIVLYVQVYKQDVTAHDFEVTSPNSFSFVTNTPDKFIVDNLIKVPYTLHGQNTLYSLVVNKTVVDETVTITLADNSFPLPINQITINSIAYASGSIYVYDILTQTLSGVIKEDLSVATVPRSVTYLNKLLICNGVDKVLVWNGDILEEVFSFVKEDTATNLVRINDNSFSFSLIEGKEEIFDATKYPDNGKIQIKNQGITFNTTINHIERLGDVITITAPDVLPVFNEPELFYQDWPPTFSYMIVAYNRIWALGIGPVGLRYRDPEQSLRVYFSYKTNTITDWFNEVTKTVPSIDLSESHGIPDNLEAIGYVNNVMVFMGRNKTQIWTGSEPLGASTDPTREVFEFSSTVPIGIVHGNLLMEMANDLYFVSQNGLLSFSTLNVAKQFAASSNDAVDPLVRDFVVETSISNPAYRACRSFKYKSGSFCGFKIGLNKVLVSLYSTNLFAWTLFSGDFYKATSYLSNLDSSLYLSVGNKIYRYADGTIGTPLYGDNNGKDLINFLWVLPIVHIPGKRFANKRYEIFCDYPSSFVVNNKNSIFIMVNGDLNKTFILQDTYNLQYKGDSLGIVPFIKPQDIGDDPENPNPNALGFRLDDPYIFLKERLKFISSNFTLNLVGSSMNGPLILKKIRLFGIIEHSS
jgi:hypothetical protein